MDSNKTTISQKIREARIKLNLSQDRFGLKIGLSGKTISAYERGKVDPPLKILEKISRVYEIDLIEIESNKKAILANKLREIEDTIYQLKELLQK